MFYLRVLWISPCFIIKLLTTTSNSSTACSASIDSSSLSSDPVLLILLASLNPDMFAFSNMFTMFSIDALLWNIENYEFISWESFLILSVTPISTSFNSLYLLNSFSSITLKYAVFPSYFTRTFVTYSFYFSYFFSFFIVFVSRAISLSFSSRIYWNSKWMKKLLLSEIYAEVPLFYRSLTSKKLLLLNIWTIIFITNICLNLPFDQKCSKKLWLLPTFYWQKQHRITGNQFPNEKTGSNGRNFVFGIKMKNCQSLIVSFAEKEEGK